MGARRLLSNVGASTVRVALSVGRAAILIPVVVRLAGVGAFGRWTVAMAVVSLASSAGSLHLHGALVRYLPTETTEGQTVADVLALSAAAAAATGLVVGLIGWATEPFGAVTVAGVPLWLAVAAAATASVPSLVYTHVPRARGRVTRHEGIRVLKLFVQTVAVIAAFVLWESAVAGVLAVAAVGATSAIAMGLAFWPRGVTPSLANVRRYAEYCLPMVPSEVAGKLLQSADRFLLLVLVSPVAAGVYAVAYAVSRVVMRLTGVLTPTLYPTVVAAWEDGDPADLTSTYRPFLRWYLILGVPAAVGAWALARPALATLATPAVARRGAGLVPLLAAGFLLQGFTVLLGYVLTAAEETRWIAAAYLGAAALNLAINLALIPLFGVQGAATATVAAQVLLAAVVVYRVGTHVRLPVPWTTLARTAVAVACMALTLRWFPVDLAPTARLAVYPPVGAAVYFAVLTVAGELSHEDLETVR